MRSCGHGGPGAGAGQTHHPRLAVRRWQGAPGGWQDAGWAWRHHWGGSEASLTWTQTLQASKPRKGAEWDPSGFLRAARARDRVGGSTGRLRVRIWASFACNWLNRVQSLLPPLQGPLSHAWCSHGFTEVWEGPVPGLRPSGTCWRPVVCRSLGAMQSCAWWEPGAAERREGSRACGRTNRDTDIPSDPGAASLLHITLHRVLCL